MGALRFIAQLEGLGQYTVTRHTINSNCLFWWLALSLCLHAVGLTWCSAPSSFSPPKPAYLVIDLISGTGQNINTIPGGGIKPSRPKELQHPIPTKPVSTKKPKIQEPAHLERKAIKTLPEELPTAHTTARPPAEPALTVSIKPHNTLKGSARTEQGILGAEETIPEPVTIATNGTQSDTGSGSEIGSSQGGYAGSGSPVETPMAYGTNPPPPYPSTARRRGWEGEVLLLVNVTTQGEVDKVTVHQSSGYQILDRAALNAVYRWEFQAAQKNGRAVAGQVMVPIRFSIKDIQ